MSCNFTCSSIGGERVLRFRCSCCKAGASIEQSEACMRGVVSALIEEPGVDAIILADLYEREYRGADIAALEELARAYDECRQWPFRYLTDDGCRSCEAERRQQLEQIIAELPSSPAKALADLTHLVNDVKSWARYGAKKCMDCREQFIERSLKPMLQTLKQVKLARGRGHGRDCYGKILRPLVKPHFSTSRILVDAPTEAKLVDAYSLGDSEVRLYRLPNKLQCLYFLIPPEYKLRPEQVALLNRARELLLERGMEKLDLSDAKHSRESFERLSSRLMTQLAIEGKSENAKDEIELLAKCLTKFSVGLGVLETLLSDERVQDIYIDAPIGRSPVHIYHGEHEECITNIYLSAEDLESIISRFRAMSGRPFSEADPVLDLNLPEFGARVAAIGPPLSPEGLALAIRRHKLTPWTLPQFVRNRFLTPEAAGLLSLLVDSQASILIAGSRGAGKTSLLGALIFEILQKYRIITIEDTAELPLAQLRALGFKVQSLRVQSAVGRLETEMRAEDALRAALRLGESVLVIGEVRSSIRGNEEVVIIENGWMKRVPIADLEGKPIDEIMVPTLDENYKVRVTKLSGFVKHPPRNRLLKVVTKTGREITVTHDHSLFTAKEFEIIPVEAGKLKPGDKIVLPAVMPCDYNDLEYLDLTKIVPESRLDGADDLVRKAISVLGWRRATEICGIRCGDIYNYFRTHQKTRIPIKAFKTLMNEAGIRYSLDNIKVKHGNCTPVPALIPVNEKFCRFLGYYISEGYFANGGVVITNSNEEILEDVVCISQDLFGIKPAIRELHGAGRSKQVLIQSSLLTNLVSRLGCGRTCDEKRVPSLIFGLSKQKIGAFLRALYSGDGSFYASEKSGNCVRYITTSKKLAEDVMYLLLTHGIVARVRKRKRGEPLNDIWQVEFKQRDAVRTFLDEIGFVHKRPRMVSQAWPHSKANVVTFSRDELRRHSRLQRKYRHLARFCRCGKNYLQRVAADGNNEISGQLRKFALGEFYLDEIKEIEEVELKKPEPVYDLSVNPSENFIGGFGGILLHNTEAKTLYEAMRVGAAGNSVMGTIHGATTRDVFDRVVYDLNIPPTSFKATDAIVVAAPIRPSGGASRARRVVQITEIGKDWKDDPINEGGFIDLMRYDATEDKLERTPHLAKSQLIAGIAKKWGTKPVEIMKNLELRTKIHKTLAETAADTKNQRLLEAEFVARSNNMLHELLEEQLGRRRTVDYNKIFEGWRRWLEEGTKGEGRRSLREILQGRG